MQDAPSAYLLFLMQNVDRQSPSQECTWSPFENIVRLANWSARNLQVKNTDVSSNRVAVHVEIMVMLGNSQSFFSTYADRKTCAWQSFDPDFYNAEDWIAVPLCQGFESVSNLVQACQNNIKSKYSFTRYISSTRLMAWTAHILDDSDNAPAHCAGLTARILKRIGMLDQSELAPTFSPCKLLTTVRANRMRQHGAVGGGVDRSKKSNHYSSMDTQTIEYNQESYFSSIWISLRIKMLNTDSK